MSGNKRHSTSFYSLSTSSDLYLSQNTSIDSIPNGGDISTELPNIKLLLIGDANVGKTAMILRFCHELPTRGQLRNLRRSNSQKNSVSASSSQSQSSFLSQDNKLLLRRRMKRNRPTDEGKKRYSSTDFDEFKKRRSLIFTNNYSSLFNEELNAKIDEHGITKDNDDDDDDDEIMLYTQSTIGVDIKTRLINIDDHFYNCTFWDTAGQERYQNAIVPSLYKNCNGIILTYDITNFTSFQDCFHVWLMESLKYIPREQLAKCRIYLVGNKIDLYQERQVTHQDILKYISQVETKLNVKIYGNFEVTCQWGEIIDNIMNSIITDLVSNDCYQDVKRYNYSPKPLSHYEGDNDDGLEVQDADGDDESFYSVGDHVIDISNATPYPETSTSCCT